jgi:hypothetical protein
MDDFYGMFPAQLEETMRKWGQRALLYVAFVLVVFGVKLLVINYFGNATPCWDQWDAEADN